MQSSFGGNHVAILVMIANLLRIQLLFVYFITPNQMKSLRLLVDILNPTSIDKYPLHPLIFWVKNEYFGSLVDLHPPSILRNQISEIFAITIDYQIYIHSSYFIPISLLPPIFHVFSYLTSKLVQSQLTLRLK